MNKLILAVAALTASFLTEAGRYNQIEYGRVIDVQPIYERVSIPEERQVCDRQSRHPHNNRYGNRKNSAGKAILGGIIGGAIGNKFGKGRGRDASTALGILIGAGIGASKNDHHRDRNYNRCYVETYYIEDERFMGYDVTYEYKGELHQAQMQEHPGDRVRLSVDVRVLD